MKYPLANMEVGDTVFIAGVTQKTLNKSRSTYAPKKFRMITMMRGGVEGTRVWRIA